MQIHFKIIFQTYLSSWSVANVSWICKLRRFSTALAIIPRAAIFLFIWWRFYKRGTCLYSSKTVISVIISLSKYLITKLSLIITFYYSNSREFLVSEISKFTIQTVKYITVNKKWQIIESIAANSILIPINWWFCRVELSMYHFSQIFRLSFDQWSYFSSY